MVLSLWSWTGFPGVVGVQKKSVEDEEFNFWTQSIVHLYILVSVYAVKICEFSTKCSIFYNTAGAPLRHDKPSTSSVKTRWKKQTFDGPATQGLILEPIFLHGVLVSWALPPVLLMPSVSRSRGKNGVETNSWEENGWEWWDGCQASCFRMDPCRLVDIWKDAQMLHQRSLRSVGGLWWWWHLWYRLYSSGQVERCFIGDGHQPHQLNHGIILLCWCICIMYFLRTSWPCHRWPF